MSYYRILGIERTATTDEIKKAYRKLAMTYHPDRNPGDSTSEVKFREVTEAYQILSDPDKRQQFDTYGKVFEEGAGFSGDAADFFDNIFGDVFGNIFGGRSRGGHSTARKGTNINVEKTISFEESIFGVDLEIKINQLHTCGTCGGRGAKPDGMMTCSTCKGSGNYTMRQGFFTVQTTCPSCNGMGKIIKEKCDTCSGSGFNEKEKSLKVKVPAGIEDSMAIRISGEGNEGLNGGPSGDLIVNISVGSHKFYKREGNDLILDLPLPFTDAVLGRKTSVPMLDGSAKEIEIKAGTQFGDNIVIKKQGAVDVRGRGKGDLIIRLNIMLPTKLNNDQKKALQNFQKTGSEDMYKKSLWQKMKSLFS